MKKAWFMVKKPITFIISRLYTPEKNVFSRGLFERLETEDENDSGNIALAVCLSVAILALLAVLAYCVLKNRKERSHRLAASSPAHVPLSEQETLVYNATTKPVFTDNTTALTTDFCYTAIIVTLLKARNFQRHKAVRVVLAVVAVFVVCHLPYNVTLLYDTANMFELQSCQDSDILQVAKTVTQTIAYLHCCLNPVLYAFVGVKFRNHFRRIVQDLWCLGKRYIAPRRFSRVTSEIYVSTRRSVDGSSENGSSFTM
ncbi:hypothetical protein EPR50_G00192230 [Perca flavescens]|uniref:G-protein coupled receptors family 1 profile domain-containing protein n=1 Tax=Perca flavescens TaxID=8167 RepID=A0A484CG21_PERFV|nr:hypothetical protein EPR50_G00192230 [Perca flavescens]